MKTKTKKIVRIATNLLGAGVFILVFLIFLLPTSASTAIETKRPTNFNDVANKTSNEANAYDNNSSTYASTTYKDDKDPSILYFGWPAAGQSYTALDLKLTYSADAATDDTYAYYYSTSGATDCSDYATRTWSTLLAPTSAGASQITLTQSLSPTQDLTQLCIKIVTDKVGRKDNKSVYTHEIWTEGTYTTNNYPTGSFNSAIQKTDGSGQVDISIEVDDPDGDDTKAKIEYDNDNLCDGPWNPATLLGTSATADFTDSGGPPDINNANSYQIGSGTNTRIITSSGSNTVSFIWDSKTDLSNGDGSYCLRLTVNDDTVDQFTPATQILTIDNVNPTSPGNLTEGGKTSGSVTLNFGSATADTNFSEYKIFYKVGSSGVTESDNEWDQTQDSNLGLIDYGGAASTTIGGLSPSTQYVFNIWAYDAYGNKNKAASEITVTTLAANNPPSSSSPSSITQATDGSGYISFQTTISDNDSNDTKLKIEYSDDGGINWYDPYLISVSTDKGDADLDNSSIYQVGSNNPIDTSMGNVTLTLVWDTKSNLNGNGSLDNIEQNNIQIKLTPHDNINEGAPATSSSFLLDNLDPVGLTSLSVGSITCSSVTLHWSSTVENNFDHYEIWYGENLNEVQNRAGMVYQIIINNQSVTTSVISGLSPLTTYYFKIWAMDVFGNEETVPYTAGTTQILLPPAYTPPEIPKLPTEPEEPVTEELQEEVEEPVIEEPREEVEEPVTEELQEEVEESVTEEPREEVEEPVYNFYRVQSGDYLNLIARKTNSSIEKLIELNKDRFPSLLANANLIYIGWNLKYEILKEGNYYTVKSGDSLSRIAQKIYGNAAQWPKLVELNKNRFPTLIINPHFIRIGWEFRI